NSLRRSNDDLRGQPKDFAIDWGADDCRNVVVFHDESTGDDDVVPRLVASLSNTLRGPADVAPIHGRACSATMAFVCRANRPRCFAMAVLSVASRSSISRRARNSTSASLPNSERFRRIRPFCARRSRAPSVGSSMEIAIVFMLEV